MMELKDRLALFMNKASEDARISRVHFSLYLALLHEWVASGHPQSIYFNTPDFMPKAKISSTATFQRTINELSAYGYIEYLPSNYKKRKSAVRLY